MTSALLAVITAITGFIGSLLLPTDTYTPPPLTYTLPAVHDTDTNTSQKFFYANLNNFTHWYGKDGLADATNGDPCRVRVTSDSGTTLYLALNLTDTVTLPVPDCVHTPPFTLLNSAYAVDGEHMYYLFPYLQIPPTRLGDDTLYVKARLIVGSSAVGARVLADDLAADSTHVYERGKKLDGLDGETFTVLGKANGDSTSWGPFAKDARAVYFKGSSIQKIEGADPRTFTPIVGPYAKDSSSVYRGTERIVGADPQSFEFLDESRFGYALARDAHAVFFYGTPVPGIDPHTVTVLSYYPGCEKGGCTATIPFLKDANGIYYYSYKAEKFFPIVGVDQATFTPLSLPGSAPQTYFDFYARRIVTFV